MKDVDCRRSFLWFFENERILFFFIYFFFQKTRLTLKEVSLKITLTASRSVPTCGHTHMILTHGSDRYGDLNSLELCFSSFSLSEWPDITYSLSYKLKRG